MEAACVSLPRPPEPEASATGVLRVLTSRELNPPYATGECFDSPVCFEMKRPENTGGPK